MFKTLDYLLKRNSLSVSVHIRNEVNKYIYIYKKKSNPTIKLIAIIIAFAYYLIYHRQLNT